MNIIENFEKMLASGQDNALLRFSLGNAYYNDGKPEQAIEHLRAAVKHDPGYSAAWKILGRSLTDTGSPGEAINAFNDGIAAAGAGGDKQAAKEMQVFRRRAEKALKG